MENMILQPIVVGGQTFKNRIMFPPLTTGYEKNGMISEQDMGFYTRLAKGGVGYIVLGDVAPITVLDCHTKECRVDKRGDQEHCDNKLPCFAFRLHKKQETSKI